MEKIPLKTHFNGSTPDGIAEFTSSDTIPVSNLPSHVHAPSEVTGTAVVTNDSRLTDARTPTEHNHTKSTITDFAHTHSESEVTNLTTDLSGKEPANSNIQTHVNSSHAPSNAQKNSDVTKAEIEAKLTGEITSHTHAGGSGGVWGAITGTLSNQTDLNSALSGKAASSHTHVPSEVTGTAVITNDARLSDARTPVTHSHAESEVTNLTTDLAAKQATLISGTNIKTINSTSLLGNGDIAISGGGLGYTINVQALTSSPADGATVYFGMMPKAPITTANVSKVYVRKSGTIKIAEIYVYSGTAGTAEAWSLYVRKNNTTDYLIQTKSVATSERVFTNADLSIAMAVGDYFEIKSIQPTWVTNPLTTIYGGYIYIE